MLSHKNSFPVARRAFLGLAVLSIALLAQAQDSNVKTLKWSSAGDFLTFDVHAQNE